MSIADIPIHQQEVFDKMEGPTTFCFRDWDVVVDGALFYGRHPTQRLLKAVRPLSEEYAQKIWDWVFPTSAEVLVQVAKKRDGWLYAILEGEPIAWDNENRLTKLFISAIPWQSKDQVFYLVRRGIGYLTSWEVYVKSPYAFLGYYGEGLLFHPTLREVAVFWDSHLSFGRRSKRRVTMH